MTEQTCTAIVGTDTFSKIFQLSATNASWQNVMLDTISSQPIGILIPNTVLNHMTVNYAAGVCAWRLQNSQSLLVTAKGFASKTLYNDYQMSRIAPVKINPNDVLMVYPNIVDPQSDDSNVLAWVQTTKGELLYALTDAPDNAATEIKTAVNGLSLGSDAFGATLTRINVQSQDASKLISCQVIDNMGGVVWTGFGNVRGAYAGSSSLTSNGMFDGLKIPIARGYSMKVTVDASI